MILSPPSASEMLPMSGTSRQTEPSFIMSRRLIRSEGLLCGGSSGSAMDAAINYIKDHKVGAGKRVVVVLPDGVRNYMTKFLNDDWMVDMGFIDFAPTTYGYIDDWKNATVGNLKIPKAVTVKRDESLARCVDLVQAKGL
jgi:cystathionine beta-synthase